MAEFVARAVSEVLEIILKVTLYSNMPESKVEMNIAEHSIVPFAGSASDLTEPVSSKKGNMCLSHYIINKLTERQ